MALTMTDGGVRLGACLSACFGALWERNGSVMNYSQRKTLATLPSNGQDWLCVIPRGLGWIQENAHSLP